MISLSNCADRFQLKNAITGLMGGVTGSYTVTVVPDEVDPMFIEYVDPLWMDTQAPPDNQACPGWSSFNVYVTSIQLDVFKQLQDRWKVFDTNKDRLMDALNNAGYLNDIKVCDLMATEVKMWVAPPSLEQAGDYDIANNAALRPHPRQELYYRRIKLPQELSHWRAPHGRPIRSAGFDLSPIDQVC